MSAPPSVLWAAAAMASLALHGAVGMVLYAMPLPAPKPHGETKVTIETLEMRIPLQTAAVSTISAAMPGTANVLPIFAGKAAAPLDLAATAIHAVQPPEAASTALSNVTTPVETGIVLPGSSPRPVDVQPSTERMAAIVSETEAIAPQPATTAAAATIVNGDAGVAASGTLAVASIPLAGSVPGDAPRAALDRSAAPAIADEAPRVAGSQPSSEIQPDAAAPVALDAVAPDMASGGSIPLAPSTLTAPKTIPAALMAGVASVVAPGLSPVVPAPAVTLAPAARPEALGTEIAMLPRPDTIGGPAPSGRGDAGSTLGLNRLSIAQFLVEENATDCLLALPTGDGLQQASIAAFSDAPEKVAKLGSEFERRSGQGLEASTYPVSRNQCGTLAFARDLAQYPDFPLRLTLSSPTIGSGQELAGTISGLRKDTLYLMVVDDEGKAELVRSYAGLRNDAMAFHAPMTLTSGPVSSAQLLVAVAADGPLRTVATRPGMPADVYFQRLKNEIIADQRSIAYGIVGFVVQ